MTSAPTLDLSVLIASHNRRELLQRCLRILEEQTQDPGSFEVIVADDGSTDGTTEMVEGLQTSYGLRALKLEKAGKPLALNAAIEAARGRVCLFIDDDVVASPELIEEHVAANERDPQTLGIGALTQKAPDDRDWFTHTFTWAWNAHYEDLESRPARWTDCYGANFSAPRAALTEIGGFATEVATVEDFDISFRLHEVGLVARYLPKAHGIHDDQKPRSRMLADLDREGAAYVEFAERHPATAAELLNWVGEAGPKELRLRRLALALRISPGLLVTMGTLVPGAGRKMVWLQFVRKVAFWRSARRAMSQDQWQRITHEGSAETAP